MHSAKIYMQTYLFNSPIMARSGQAKRLVRSAMSDFWTFIELWVAP